MRDLETIHCSVRRETGLVFALAHSDAAETIQRIIAFPARAKTIRLQLASTLKAVVGQRLERRADNQGRVPAVEVMMATAYIRDSSSILKDAA